jgi:alpha-tubulin suppressor-like RCC1 family protein
MTGVTTSPTDYESGTTYSSYAVGPNHRCGITTAGALRCWGNNGSGQIGNNSTSEATAPVTIDSGTTYASATIGSSHTCAITTAGVLKCWGDGSFGALGSGQTTTKKTPVIINSGTTYAAVSAGATMTMAVTTAGVLQTTGENSMFQLGHSAGTSPVKSFTTVDSGVTYSQPLANIQNQYMGPCAITSGGILKCWGNDMNSAWPTALGGARFNVVE